MADVSGLTASVSGNTVTLTWSNPVLPFSECTPPGHSNFPTRTWSVYRDGTLIWSETRDAAHAAPNGRTSYSETVADGSYLYEVQLIDKWGLLLDTVCAQQTTTGNKVAIQADVNVVDTTPDPFDLGPDATNVTRGSTQLSDVITVTGIGAPATITITGTGASYAVNGGAWTTAAGSVTQGDRVQVRIIAAPTFSTTRTATLTIGGVTDTWSVTTTADATGPIIAFPKSSPPVSLYADVRAFFGPAQQGLPAPPQARLTDYLRGGAYVPDITANSSVPIAPPIHLTELLGTAVALGFADGLSGQGGSVPNTVGATVTLVWKQGVDFALLPGLAEQVEYRWTLTTTDSSPRLSLSSSPTGTWSRTQYFFNLTGQLAQPLSAGEVASTSGSLKVDVRSIHDTAQVISSTANWAIYAVDTA